jgi:hypothetical protein
MAPEFLVMNFEIGCATAELTSPAIAAEYLHAEVSLLVTVQPPLRGFALNAAHKAAASAT